MEQIEDLYIMSEMDLNTKLLNFAAQNGIVIHFLIITSFIREAFIRGNSF